MHSAPIPRRIPRPRALCTRSLLDTPGLGSGARFGAPCTIAVTLSTASRHKVAKKTGTAPNSARGPPRAPEDGDRPLSPRLSGYQGPTVAPVSAGVDCVGCDCTRAGNHPDGARPADPYRSVDRVGRGQPATNVANSRSPPGWGSRMSGSCAAPGSGRGASPPPRNGLTTMPHEQRAERWRKPARTRSTSIW